MRVGKVGVERGWLCGEDVVWGVCGMGGGGKGVGGYVRGWEVVEEDGGDVGGYVVRVRVKKGDEVEEGEGDVSK